MKKTFNNIRNPQKLKVKFKVGHKLNDRVEKMH